MALFGRAKEPLLREFLALPHGIPSHDTFSRVFRFLDPAAFEMAFRRFTAAFAERLSGRTGLAGTVVAIDGKSLAGACEAGARATPLHLVTAWAADQRLVLAQRRAPGRSEVTAALEVVGMLDLLGATVTADALHGTRRMAAAIRARGGNYALVVKGNRGPLHRAMRDLGERTAHGRRAGEPRRGRSLRPTDLIIRAAHRGGGPCATRPLGPLPAPPHRARSSENSASTGDMARLAGAADRYSLSPLGTPEAGAPRKGEGGAQHLVVIGRPRRSIAWLPSSS